MGILNNSVVFNVVWVWLFSLLSFPTSAEILASYYIYWKLPTSILTFLFIYFFFILQQNNRNGPRFVFHSVWAWNSLERTACRSRWHTFRSRNVMRRGTRAHHAQTGSGAAGRASAQTKLKSAFVYAKALAHLQIRTIPIYGGLPKCRPAKFRAHVLSCCYTYAWVRAVCSTQGAITKL